jgi:hypothetical protein
MSEQSFADRIRERFPRGLTGVFAIGGTRTTYILNQNRDADNPGRIGDFAAHGEYLQTLYCELMKTFFDLGGQNMVITASSFRGFHERGSEYARLVTKEMLRLTDATFQCCYADNDVDPYFVGIDTLLHLPESSEEHQMAVQLADFQRSWKYQPGHRKLIWEVASIPLFSFWKAFQSMGEAERTTLDRELAELESMQAVHELLYRRFSRAVYGTELPMPQFYLGTNKSGDLKWRSPMPIALTGGEYMRLFYTPYPSLFITRETLQAILQDLAFIDRFHSLKTDYSGQYDHALVQAEYERVTELSSRPETTVGLSRKVSVSG